MAEIKVARVPGGSNNRHSKRELYAMVCYMYPQYDLKKASQLPARDLYLLINTANKLQAAQNLNLVQIAAAPHSKKGEQVKKLIDHFKKLSE